VNARIGFTQRWDCRPSRSKSSAKPPPDTIRAYLTAMYAAGLYAIFGGTTSDS